MHLTFISRDPRRYPSIIFLPATCIKKKKEEFVLPILNSVNSAIPIFLDLDLSCRFNFVMI